MCLLCTVTDDDGPISDYTSVFNLLCKFVRSNIFVLSRESTSSSVLKRKCFKYVNPEPDVLSTDDLGYCIVYTKDADDNDAYVSLEFNNDVSVSNKETKKSRITKEKRKPCTCEKDGNVCNAFTTCICRKDQLMCIKACHTGGKKCHNARRRKGKTSTVEAHEHDEEEEEIDLTKATEIKIAMKNGNKLCHI